MLFGAHESVAGGLSNALLRAEVDGCQAVQIFTKNSSAWREPTLTDDAVAAFRREHARLGGVPAMAHTSYLLNLASSDGGILARSKDALANEILRATKLGIHFVVMHPGAHCGAGEGAAIRRIAQGIDEVHDRTAGATARLLLENTAGQGTCVGHRFEHLAAILGACASEARMGICFDTQHAFAAGYDLSTAAGYADTFEQLDRVVGLARVEAFHLNDSKRSLGARVDRHEHVGEGLLGLKLFRRLANDPRFAETPGVVEIAPRDKTTPYKADVSLLQGLVRPRQGGPAQR